MFGVAGRGERDAGTLTATLWGGMRRWSRALLAGAGRAGAAHSARSRIEEVAREMGKDSGLSAEDATGINVWQADLPFFMQSGFGRR